MKFMRPDENMVLFGTVSGGAATGYTDDHLVDGRPGRPVKEPNGSPGGIAWAITGPTSKEVNAVVVANHNLQAGLNIIVTGGGGLTASITTPALGADDIAFNAWAETDAPVTTNTITVTIPPNVDDIIVGEVLAGKLRSVDPGILLGDVTDYLAHSELPNGKASSLSGYEEPIAQRSLPPFVVIGPQATKDLMDGWWQSARSSTRPSVLIPHDCLNDAIVGRLMSYSAQTVGGPLRLWKMTFTFLEYPRSRW